MLARLWTPLAQAAICTAVRAEQPVDGEKRITRRVKIARAMGLARHRRLSALDARRGQVAGHGPDTRGPEFERRGDVRREPRGARGTFVQLLQTARKVAHTIAGYNLPAVRCEAVNRTVEAPLSEGVLHGRHLFHAALATEGQKEVMFALLAKRAPVFRHP